MTAPNSPAETIGNYDLLDKLGAGSMGTVYKARHWETRQIVAIKVMPAEIARNPVLIKRFEQEFRITSKLDHPNIVRVLEFSKSDSNPYLVMELVDGESLGDKLERDGKLSEDESIQIILQVAQGLHRAHRQGLIHRDIKPDNIMVTKDGVAKLTDLGLAKDNDADEGLTRTGRGLGTPDYIAPEQFRNAKNASVRCDVYGLGATLYHMVTGKIPFDEPDPVQAMLRKLRNDLPTPRDVNRAISERTDWAIRRAMSANADNRPASCREFAEDLLGKSTRPGSKGDFGDEKPEPGDEWHVVYMDGEGMLRTAKGDTHAVRQALKSGQYGNVQKARLSRSPSGPFTTLHGMIDFRDLVVEPTPGPPLSETSMTKLSQLGERAAEAPKPRKRFIPPEPPPAPRDPEPPAEPESQFFVRVPAQTDKQSESAFSWLPTVLLVMVAMLGSMAAAKYLLPMVMK